MDVKGNERRRGAVNLAALPPPPVSTVTQRRGLGRATPSLSITIPRALLKRAFGPLLYSSPSSDCLPL